MLELSPEELETKLNEERDAFSGYLERFESETLEENEQNPIKFDACQFPIFSVSKIPKLAFATADNPFYKPERCKYFPEVVVMTTEGEVLAKIGADGAEG